MRFFKFDRICNENASNSLKINYSIIVNKIMMNTQQNQLLQDQFQVQALIQKPIKYVENLWGQSIRVDKSKVDFDTEMSFWPKFGKDRLNMGSLPYTTSPRLKKNIADRIIPVDTQLGCSRACTNEALAQAGPWYLRHWQIWDYAPFKPTSGDVTRDPRYGVNTRQFTKPYRTSGI